MYKPTYFAIFFFERISLQDTPGVLCIDFSNIRVLQSMDRHFWRDVFFPRFNTFILSLNQSILALNWPDFSLEALRSPHILVILCVGSFLMDFSAIDFSKELGFLRGNVIIIGYY
jgi:hypothetical protein